MDFLEGIYNVVVQLGHVIQNMIDGVSYVTEALIFSESSLLGYIDLMPDPLSDPSMSCFGTLVALAVIRWVT